MAPRFLSKTAVSDGQLLTIDGAPALRLFERLQAGLARQLGPDAAALFAEPVASWGGEEPRTVSWYADAPGDAVPFASLPPGRQAPLAARLRAELARVVPLLDGAGDGALLRLALCVRGPDSVFAVGDRIVVTEWGIVPDGAARGADPAALLDRSALAPFLPGRAAPPPLRPVPQAAAAAVPVAAAAPVARRDGPGRAWFAVPAALAVAAAFLALGYWRGAVLATDRANGRNPGVSVVNEEETRRAIRQQEERNAALEKQIEERRKLLEGNVCLADPATMPRLGPDRAAALPPAVVPPPPGGQPFQGNLADLLKQSIVMVMALGENDSLGLGTGFFVAPDLIATNRHVVEGAVGGRVMVVNVKLGRPVAGTVAAETPTSDIGSLDVALIRIPPQAGVQPLAFTPVAAELDPVIAAGYPALITRSDAGMMRLLRDGDLASAPQLILTDGRIQAVQTSPGGIRIMPHGAAISGGNSGGPLVDGCGRVVGINTFVRADTESSAHANYAIKSDSVTPFLKEHGVPFIEVAGPCAPGAPAAPPVTPAAAPGGSSPASPPTSPVAPPAAPPAASPAASPAAPAAPQR